MDGLVVNDYTDISARSTHLTINASNMYVLSNVADLHALVLLEMYSKGEFVDYQ